MGRFLLKRSLYGFFVLLGVLVLTFALFNLLPADPSRLVAGQRSDPESLKAIRQELGLNHSTGTRFLIYLNNLSPISRYQQNNAESAFQADPAVLQSSLTLYNGTESLWLLKAPYLGRSFQSRKPVHEILAEAFPQTFVLALAAMLFATLAGIALGAIMALKKDTFWDRFILFVSILGMAGPSFFVAILVAWIFGFELSHITGLNMTGSLYAMDDLGRGEHIQWKSLILPAFTLGIRPLATIAQLARNSFLEVLSQDYIRTARAKGLSEWRVMRKHALPNALNPVITASSGWFAGLLAGAVFIEYIFGWHGIGKEMVDAMDAFDFPVVMGSVLLISVFFVFINIMVDVIYGWLDPRVRIN